MLAFFFYLSQNQKSRNLGNRSIKIGLVSPLTGDFAFYGESTKAGAELAKKDLAKQGIEIQITAEDGQIDAARSLSAAQKLISVDGVQAIYSDLNPAAIAISSYIKGKKILHVYDAAPVSPLEDNPLVYKTYIDFVVGCQKVAQHLKDRGIQKVGVLSLNLEAGDLCTEGVSRVFGGMAFVEKYNPGTTDFIIQLLKLSQNGIQAVFNVSFPAETFSSLKDMRAAKINVPFVGSSDSFSPDLIAKNASLLEGVLAFGLPQASDSFIEDLRREVPQSVGYYPAAALAYIHIKQMAIALDACAEDSVCIQDKMDRSEKENVIGFGGFEGHIAQFMLPIQEFLNGHFVTVP